jgi:hypothetical protein
MKYYVLTSAFAAVIATLTACGGGSGGSGSDSTPAQTYLTTKYVGTWLAGCYQHFEITDLKTSEPTFVTDAMTFKSKDNKTLTVTYTGTVYASTDTTCTGTPLGKVITEDKAEKGIVLGPAGIESSNGPNTVTIDGVAKVGDLQVDQVSVKFVAMSTSMGANATLSAGSGNQFKLNVADFGEQLGKSIFYLKDNKLTLGEFDPSIYPTVLSTDNASIFIKQP